MNNCGRQSLNPKTYSKATLTRNVLIRRRNTSRNGGEKSERRSSTISTVRLCRLGA